jgi:hypothetical protein
MSGFVLHVGAKVICSHPPGGDATPATSNPRVKVGGQNTILVTDAYVIGGGCPVNTPCATATWTHGANRVKSLGRPLVLTDSQSTSLPNAAPLRPISSQTRVKAG